MPLSDPAPRKPMHKRAIECHGYRRDDGLWDIEAHMVDTKSYGFTNSHRGDIAPGEPLHDMWLRLTVDENFVVRGAEAATDAGPFAVCPAITSRFAMLEGLQIGSGWMRKLHEVVGGVNGCTHLFELLRPMATVAFQTIWSTREKTADDGAAKTKPGYLDRCHALASDGAVVRENFPEWYTGD